MSNNPHWGRGNPEEYSDYARPAGSVKRETRVSKELHEPEKDGPIVSFTCEFCGRAGVKRQNAQTAVCRHCHTEIVF